MSEGETVPSGSFKGWKTEEVHEFGAESALSVDEVRKTWKKLEEDDKRVVYNTGGGIYLEHKETGRLTRIGDLGDKPKAKGEPAYSGKK